MGGELQVVHLEGNTIYKKIFGNLIQASRKEIKKIIITRIPVPVLNVL